MAPRGRLVVVLALCTTLAPGARAEELLQSGTCGTPQVLTGTNQLHTVGIDAAIVWDGAAYGVVYENTATSDVWFNRVAADGTSLVPATNLSTSGLFEPSLTWSGSEYGLAWDQGTNIYFKRISVTGAAVGSDVPVSTGGTAGSPSILWNGSLYGIAWEDSRDGNFEIYTNLVSAAGVVAGADARITSDAAQSSDPALGWSGSSFLVAWTDLRDGNLEIYAARVSGNVKVGSDVRVTTDAAISASPSLAWTGTEYGLAWRDLRNANQEIYLARLDHTGAKSGADVRITLDAATSTLPTIAWTGAEYGLAWQDDRDGGAGLYETYFARISQAGAKVGGDQRMTFDLPSSDMSDGRTIAFGTKGFGIVESAAPAGTFLPYFIGVGCEDDVTPPVCPSSLSITGNSASGVTLSWFPASDPENEIAFYRVYRDFVPIGITASLAYTDSPRPSGTPAYMVTAVNAERVESTGCAVVTAPVPPTGDCGEDWSGIQILRSTSSITGRPDAAWDGRAYGVAWHDLRDSNYEIYFARSTSAGVRLGADVRVTTDVAHSQNPSVASTGSGHGIAWDDNRNGSTEIYFAPLTVDGTKSGSDVRVTLDPSSSSRPSLAWTGSEFGVAWNDARDSNLEIYFVRLTATGVKVGPDVRVTSDAAVSQDASLVWTGSEFGVAWQDARDGNSEIYFARLSSSGSKQGTDLRVTTDGSSSVLPSLAWTGSEFGVAWEDARDGNSEIYFARLSAGGVKLGTDVRVSFDPATSAEPALVWTGSEYGTSWADLRFNPIAWETLYAVVDAGGTVVMEQRMTYAVGVHDVWPDLAMGGRGLGLVYSHWASGGDQIRFHGLGCGPVDTSPPSCPSSPSELSRTPGSPGSVTIGWGASLEPDSDLSHYAILRDGTPLGVTVATFYTDATFDPAAGHVYWIDAMNAAGYATGPCAVVDTSDAVPPTCPTNVLATSVTQTSATISWLPSSDLLSGVRRYHVYKDNVLETTVTTTSANIAGLTANTTYNFAVLSEDWAGNLSSSCASANTIYISTSPITLFVTKNGDAIHADLDWNDAGLNEYVIYRSVSPQWASEHERVPVSETDDPVLQDGVQLWYYYIQQRGL